MIEPSFEPRELRKSLMVNPLNMRLRFAIFPRGGRTTPEVRGFKEITSEGAIRDGSSER